MKIIGWDIGIKNLSYCLLDTEQNTTQQYKEYFEFNDNKYYLVDWQVINLIPKLTRNDNEILLKSRNITDTCCYIIKNKKGDEKQCSSKPKVVSWSNDDIYLIQFYCNKHKKHLLEDLPKEIKDKTIFEDISDKGTHCNIKDCSTNAVFVNSKNQYYGYCRKHYNALIKSKDLIETDVKKIIKEKKADKNDLTVLSEALYNELDKFPQILNANCVLFENQPVLKNPTMKSMQIFLYGYYMMRGYLQSDKAVDEIHCYNANKKIEMQCFVQPEDLKEINDDVGRLKSKYSRTKKKGIALVEYFFSNNYTNEGEMGENGEFVNEVKIQVFSDKKKRDDLADSLLMTLHYLEKKSIGKLKNKSLAL
jgi:hypothetical protein